eukprot:1160774-Pelagomonas_calceolata.AAC.8
MGATGQLFWIAAWLLGHILRDISNNGQLKFLQPECYWSVMSMLKGTRSPLSQCVSSSMMKGVFPQLTYSTRSFFGSANLRYRLQGVWRELSQWIQGKTTIN